jgi:hypothetical protein
MSTPAILTCVYLGIGMIFLIVAVASPGKEERTKFFGASSPGDSFDAAVLLFIAALWPLWLISLLTTRSKK